MSRLTDVLRRGANRNTVRQAAPIEMTGHGVPVFVFADWFMRTNLPTNEERAVYDALVAMVDRAKTRLRTNVHKSILEIYL